MKSLWEKWSKKQRIGFIASFVVCAAVMFGLGLTFRHLENQTGVETGPSPWFIFFIAGIFGAVLFMKHLEEWVYHD